MKGPLGGVVDMLPLFTEEELRGLAGKIGLELERRSAAKQKAPLAAGTVLTNPSIPKKPKKLFHGRDLLRLK